MLLVLVGIALSSVSLLGIYVRKNKSLGWDKQERQLAELHDRLPLLFASASFYSDVTAVAHKVGLVVGLTVALIGIITMMV